MRLKFPRLPRVVVAASQSSLVLGMGDVCAQYLEHRVSFPSATSSSSRSPPSARPPSPFPFFSCSPSPSSPASCLPLSLPSSFDLARTGRWAAVGGCVHGPFFFLGMRKIDRLFGPGVALRIVAQKTLAAQLFLFP
eukprot:GHVT01064908.1.p2 GENE.GHVT01064908.1~~GHVT01064908.1.p2  ORF type:complete len:136 (-),score=37.06 GHVT01064908.1:1685-2092(-)